MADDEGFGDFNFVSAATFYPNPSTAQPQFAASDDDWGDFVTVAAPPVKPPVVNGFAPTPVQAQAPADPFGFFDVSNGAAAKKSAGSDPNPIRVEAKPDGVSKTRQWEKLKGALPLSLFGEEERDEQASQDLTGLTENEGFGRKESNLNVKKGGIDDLISNLYVQNGSGPNSGSGGGLIGRSNGNGVDLKFEGVDINGSSNSSGAKLNEEEGNGDFDEEEDDGWEFKAPEPEQRGGNENSKGQGVVEVAEVRAKSSTFVNGGIQAGIVYC